MPGENITRTLSANLERRSRLIALKKKDKPPDKLTNLRTIQILPSDVRITEQQ